jgi:hypothetical protein
VPGYAKLDDRRKLLEAAKAFLVFEERGTFRRALVGKGEFRVGDDLFALFAGTGAANYLESKNGLMSLRRTNAEGKVYFINNRGAASVNDWVRLRANAQSVALFDPMTGKSGIAKWRRDNEGNLDVWLQLRPFESVIVQTYTNTKSGNSYAYVETNGEPQTINGEWTLEFLNGGPVLPAKTTLNKPATWTGLNGDDVKNFSGTAKYTVNFDKPAGNPTSWLLDLGKVYETAEVILNGKRIATLIGPGFQTVIPASVLQQKNKLEIIVANLMANRIAYMDRNNIPWKIFYNTNMPARRRENVKNGLFDASTWQPLPSGLAGPVTITPLK